MIGFWAHTLLFFFFPWGGNLKFSLDVQNKFKHAPCQNDGKEHWVRKYGMRKDL